MIPVDVTARVWPRRVRAGVALVVLYPVDVSGGSADRMAREKSVLEVRATLEEGKNRSEVTVLTCALLVKDGVAFNEDSGRMKTEPS